MLDQLFQYTTNGNISLTNALVTMLVAFVMGVIISLTYVKTAEKETYSPSFCYTLIIVPIVAAIIIMLVGSNLATAFSVSGAFALVRFRSEPGNPKNIAYIFATVAAGLACGVQCYLYAGIFTVFLCLVLVVLSKVHFGEKDIRYRKLKILVPEDLNFEGVFDDIIAKYALSSELIRIGTLDLGSVYELNYDVTLKKDTDSKKFIDEIRTRNGNLTVALYLKARKGEA
ncbi:MAG: DUF4956 domain-containing protein [Firmicutes bacterium]|nr:DUF4956 domain-containing protein [Bacillota bacterium]